MSFTSIILIIITILVMLFIFLIKILNTSAGRIFLINMKMRREEKEKKKELSNFQKITLEQAKNPDEFLDLILKMKMGERVNIPLAAFSYIYKNLDFFTIFDKNGNLTIIDQSKYFEFKEKATRLIKDNSETKKDDIEAIIKKEKEKKATKPIEISEYPDGTFVKRDYAARIIEIKKPNDEKILINMDDDSIILENLKDIEIEENDKQQQNKKEYAKQQQKKEKEDKEIRQKVKLLQNQKDELEEKLLKEKDENKENNDIDSAIKNVENKKDKDKNTDKEEKLENIDTVKKQKETKKQEKPKNNKLDNIFKQTPQKFEKIEEDEPKVKLTFNNSLTHFSNQIKHKYITDILHFIVKYDSDRSRKFVIFDNNLGCILLNVNWFIYRLSLLIMNQNERETFINAIFSDKKKGFIDNNFLTEIIKKMNYAGKYKFGTPIIKQEEKDGKIINFKSAKILDKKDNKLYRGNFLYLFIKNETLKNSLNKNKELDLIFENECSVEITDEKAIKMNFEDIN